MLSLPKAFMQILDVPRSRQLETRLDIISCAALMICQQADEALFQGVLCLACFCSLAIFNHPIQLLMVMRNGGTKNNLKSKCTSNYYLTLE